MTDQTLKTVLVTALEDASVQGDHAELNPWGEDQEVIWITPGHHREEVIVDADRLTTAIRDHVFDRDKVGQAVREAINGSMKDGRGGWSDYGFSTDTDCSWDTDDLIDRLIEGLTR